MAFLTDLWIPILLSVSSVNYFSPPTTTRSPQSGFAVSSAGGAVRRSRSAEPAELTYVVGHASGSASFRVCLAFSKR